VGVKWNINNEDFMKGNTTFSGLSLRASWGITGNQEFPAGASLEQFSSGAYNNIGQSNVANPDLKWEKTTTFDVGAEFAIMKNRVTATIDYYHKNTTDLLFQSTAIQPAPASVFYINLPANLINQGVEVGVGASIVAKKTFSWDLGVNFAYNKNLLKNFNQAPILTDQVSGNGVSGATAQVIANGYPVNEYFLKQFSGYTQTGQQIISDNPVYAGDSNPHSLLGFSTTLRYNKLSLVMNGSGAFGFLIYNNTFNTITNISQLQKGQNIALANIGSQEAVSSGVAASTRYLEKGD
ncbi:MAG TPA: TonB-dependent receptor, partial [Flavisolibacter sp.]|nr:TonB-dependent receptor [Flavisolibacter sp.]